MLRMPPPTIKFSAKLKYGIALGAAVIGIMPATALACTQVWVPGKYTADGSRYVGRSEDGGERYFKTYGISLPQKNTTYRSAEGTFSWTSSKTSYRYSYVRDAAAMWGDGCNDAYSAAGVNEKGVSCSATLSIYPNNEVLKADNNLDSGIGEYNYASIILGESASAREAVELLGSLVDDHGTYSCDQITVSDPAESWLFMAVSGHQWLAFKLPQDKVSVNPNMASLLFDVDLEDAENCIHSEGLIKMPEEHGFLKYKEDGVTPDIALTYGTENPGSDRYVQGRAYFDALDSLEYHLGTNGKVASITAPELFFVPGKTNLTTYDVIRSTAARGEGTNVDANKNAKLDAIGKQWQMESHFFEIRQGLPTDIATIQWLALGPCEFSVSMPLYSALITETSPYFKDTSMDVSHGDEEATTPEPDGSIDYVLIDINTLAFDNRDSMASGTRAYLDALQNEIIEQQDIVDEIMKATPAEERTALANKAEMTVVEQTYLKCDKLLDEMRAYLETGDTSKPFAPSDLAEDGALASPLLYAPAFVGPMVTAQPASATYEQGAQASDLSIKAQADDGVGTVAYEWFTKTAAGETSTGVKSANMPVDTSKVGATEYFCRVTGAGGLSVDSAPVTITVTEPAAKPDPKPEEKPSTKPTNPSKGDLPQTGDFAAMAALASAVGVGVTALGINKSRRRK